MINPYSCMYETKFQNYPIIVVIESVIRSIIDQGILFIFPLEKDTFQAIFDMLGDSENRILNSPILVTVLALFRV